MKVLVAELEEQCQVLTHLAPLLDLENFLGENANSKMNSEDKRANMIKNYDLPMAYIVLSLII